ncbi:hypothetical protein A0H81_14949 [Grifola frondosa]|uniref:Arrestin-like N-terminal domain-containing protein n=1 Tax=Grifola frondosa TaxID=5627 RepID=A0A1C7LM00_GRIFR|nr:hypothetical protein A0H81_14949 [Grifola frondosa]
MESKYGLMLHLTPILFVAGTTIEGEVELNFTELQEEQIDEVHIKLRGSVHTWIRNDETSFFEYTSLVRENAPIWSRGTVYPTPGTHLLRVPFSLNLPAGLPPSFHFRAFQRTASVRYSIQLVGVRPGSFRINRRIRRPLAVVPTDPAGALVSSALRLGWLGPWRTAECQDKIRKGLLWGDYAHVKAELTLPAVDVLTLFAPIPLTITVTTTTAPTKHRDAESSTSSKPIFPAPPAAPTDLELTLHRRVHIRAKVFAATCEQLVVALHAPPVHVDVEGPDKEWVSADTIEKPETDKKGAKGDGDGEKGVWVQRVTMRLAVSLACPPSFAIDNIKNDYFVRLKVPFAGIGNTLVLQLPVRISSGIEHARVHPDLDVLAQLPTLDLPRRTGITPIASGMTTRTERCAPGDVFRVSKTVVRSAATANVSLYHVA